MSIAAQRTPYFLVRAYVEKARNDFDVHLIGYITREHFFDSKYLTVKSMPKVGKSERAIYYALQLKHGYPLSAISDTIMKDTSLQSKRAK